MNSLRKNLGFRKQLCLACYVVCSGLYFFTAEICLFIVLYRFAFPSTLNKLEIMFVGYSILSQIVTHGSVQSMHTLAPGSMNLTSNWCCNEYICIRKPSVRKASKQCKHALG